MPESAVSESTLPPVPGAGEDVPEGAPPWTVYVLWSPSRMRTYVGITTDVERRLRQHNGDLVGGARSTRAGRPWSVGARYGPFVDRSRASRAERALKRVRGRARLGWQPPAALLETEPSDE